MNTQSFIQQIVRVQLHKSLLQVENCRIHDALEKAAKN